MSPGASRFVANRLRDLAWGCGFSALLGPPVAYGLALDEIAVRSRLGQPLEAVIPVSAAAGEVLDSACFSVAAADGTGMPGIENIKLRLDRTTGQLTLRSIEPVREPLSEVTIRVRCDGAPTLDRTFLVVLDPPDARAESVYARATATPAETQRDAGATRFAPAADVSSAPIRAVGLPQRRVPHPVSIAPEVAIVPGSEYVVSVGDTLSSIAARVSGRPSGSVWTISERIHADNPMAFLDGNPDRLIAGVAIAIPQLDGELATRHSYVTHAATSFASAALPTRGHDNVHELRRFVLSTSLSPESLEKLKLRQVGYREAARTAASARLSSIFGDPLAQRPEEPAEPQAEEPVAVPVRDAADDEIENVASTDDGEGVEHYRQSNLEESAPVVAEAATPAAQAPTPVTAPVAPVAAPADTTADLAPAPAAPAPVRRGSGVLGWILSTLAVLIVGGIAGALLLRHRRTLEQRRIQTPKRASGLERAIRLHHGIEVKEHPAGTPLTVDASTAEIAAIRIAPARAPAKIAPVSEVIPERRPDMLEFATEAPTDVTLEMQSPIAALDLELPESPPDVAVDASDVPTEVMKAVAQRDPLADSRQFLVDTDLLALAYSEDPVDLGSADPLPLDVMAELPMPSAGGDAGGPGEDGFFHLQSDTLDDTPLAVEQVDESKLLDLWELKEDDDDALPNAVAVARAAKKR